MRKTDLDNHYIPLPPLEEQKEIVDYIETKLNKIDKLISITNLQIEKIKQYKNSLINEVVTGKRKV